MEVFILSSAALIFLLSALALIKFVFIEEKILQLLFFLLLIRFFLNSIPEITYPPVFAGLSLNALFSISVVLLGVFFIKSIFNTALFFIIILNALSISISSILNGTGLSSVDEVTRWLFFLVIIALTYQATLQHDKIIVAKVILYVSIYPILNQLYSIITNDYVYQLYDNSYNYIGSFSHESMTSILLFGVIPVSIFLFFQEQSNISRKLLLITVIGLSINGVMFANYRTVTLGMISYFFILFLLYIRKIPVFILLSLFFFFILLMTFSQNSLVNERFEAIYIIFEQPLIFLKPPESFSRDEIELMSGRFYLWSSYINEFLNGDTINRLFGYGPGSGSERFGLYAHNAFVGILYEQGFFGFFVFLIFALYSIQKCIKCVNRNDIMKILASFPISMFVIALGTMPFYNIEGFLFFGIYFSLILADGTYAKHNAFLNKQKHMLASY